MARYKSHLAARALANH